MTYYQILKQRRLDLNLSVQDVSIQTHLKPEYIRAIEENNLDVFSDDFSYVRYFVRAYCDAIGVNWTMIQKEVDATIQAHAAARDQALSAARQQMIRSMPAAKATKKSNAKGRRRRKKKFLQNSAGRISRLLNWDEKSRLAKSITVGAICVVGGLAIFSYVSDWSASRSAQQAKEAREEELRRKEEETQQMADQLKEQKGLTDEEPVSYSATVTADSQTNTFTVSAIEPENEPLQLAFTAATPAQVTIYLDSSPVFNQDVDGDGAYQVRAAAGSKIRVVFDTVSTSDQLSINGASVDVDWSALNKDISSGIVLNIEPDQEKNVADHQVYDNADDASESEETE